MSVSFKHWLAVLAVGQHIVYTGELILVSAWTCSQVDESITMKNEIVCSAGKSIIQMLRGHQLVQYTQSASPVILYSKMFKIYLSYVPLMLMRHYLAGYTQSA